MITIWLIIVLLGVVGWLIFQFNSLVGLSNHIDHAWAEIDAQLARRYDLVAKLLDLVKPHTSSDGAVFEQLNSARTAAMAAYTPTEKSRTEPALTAGIERTLSTAHGLPQLATNAELQELQHTLADIEEYLRGARRGYNAMVARLNGQAGSFPNSFLASLFGVQSRELFQVDAQSPPVAARRQG